MYVCLCVVYYFTNRFSTIYCSLSNSQYMINMVNDSVYLKIFCIENFEHDIFCKFVVIYSEQYLFLDAILWCAIFGS